MRILPVTSAGSSAATREVQAQRTPANVGELRAALARAHQKLTGQAAPAGLLDVLTAQVSLETAHGGSMYNFNFGGIKGSSPNGASATYGTREVEDGKDVHIRAHFRAYDSIDEGAEDYLRVMGARFGSALAPAERGDLDGFAHALKQAGYYTAPESEYRSALHANAAPSAGGGGPPPVAPPPKPLDFASSGDLSRVIDALSLDASRIAAPLGSEGDMS